MYDTSVASQIIFGTADYSGLGTFPSLKSLQRRGGCGINQKSRSHRRAADGVLAHAPRCTNAFRSIACERPRRPRLFSERIHFANGASTPPLQGGECTHPKSVSNTKWDTTLEGLCWKRGSSVVSAKAAVQTRRQCCYWEIQDCKDLKPTCLTSFPVTA